MRSSQSQASKQSEKESMSNSRIKMSPSLSSKKQIITQLVKEWYKNFEEEGKDYSLCYQNFIEKYCKAMRMTITFDNSVSRTLVELSKDIEFLQFNNQKENHLKKTLEFINEILKEKDFISQRQYTRFKNEFPANSMMDYIYLLQNNLKDQGFIKNKHQGEPLKKVAKDMAQENKNILVNLWEVAMMPPLETFWRFVIKEKIQEKRIFTLFLMYERLLEEQSTRQLRRQVTLYLKQIYDRKKAAKVAPIHQADVSMIAYDQILNEKAEYISVFLNKQRWQKFQKQYETLTEFLFNRCNKKEIRFEPYGSFQSKFYVVKYSDIDIGLYYDIRELNQREKVCDILKKICEAIYFDKHHLPGCMMAKTFTDERIKIPFVKVTYNSSYGRDKEVVPSMDIIINNYEGLENSKMLALYAEDEYILKFCNLIKYWAANKNLINMQRKFQGLSSYGVLLMCIYYLMVTKQIPYLRKVNKQYIIGKEKFNITHKFLDNFIGFLKFYSQEYADYDTGKIMIGQFHHQKRIVCLLQEHEGKKLYEESLIINMYDFIDDSNPGRMRTYLKDKFREIFEKTLECLEERSLSFLEIVYNEDEEVNRPRFARRGNRF